MKRTALVLFSGGQDSTTCLAWALQNYDHVETIGFDYGQRHVVELECRQKIIASMREKFPAWGKRLGADHLLDMKLLSEISDTAMTTNKAIEVEKSGLPNTFVPGRNLLFFSFAAAVAYRRELKSLVGGMCETDFSGYPDCRDNTLKSLQVTLSLGMDYPLVIETPLMWLNKQQTWQMAFDLGGGELLEVVREQSHTCYLGDRKTWHEWGYGCAICPACELRAKGYEGFAQEAQA
jgi:7-cyano-7-deazaguanine synthase